MTSTEAIRKIKVLLGLEKFEATANLADGTPVHVDTDFEVGTTLHVVQEDGTFVPAPEGEHLLEDGRKLYVDAAGVITAIEEEATEEAAPAEAPVVEEAMEEVVVEDVPNYGLMVGVPARQIGWVGKDGVKLIEQSSKVFRCPVSKKLYRLEGSNLIEEE